MNKMAVIVTSLTITILGFAMVGSFFVQDKPLEGPGDTIFDPGSIDQDPVSDIISPTDPTDIEDSNPPLQDGRDEVFDGGGVVDPPDPPDLPTDPPVPDPPIENETEPPIDIPENVSEEEVISPFLYSGTAVIDGIGTFEFEPADIITSRDDIFQRGYFSLFDILVHLDDRGDIEMEFEFDKEYDTHLIKKINDLEDWWYWSHYDGGWREDNAWRMDLYPYKDNSTIHFHQESSNVIEGIFDVFKDEVEQRKDDDGKVIVKKVMIRSNSFDIDFEDVEVTAHNIRNDTFKEGVITAIDVIMSLGDQGKITYDLSWYESIGSAGIVKNYFVTMINGDESYGTCGYVYETGYYRMNYRNHIHIPSDHRVIISPEYEEFFWICL
jgi:hypothetical protein